MCELEQSSPVRVKGENPTAAEFCASTISATFVLNFCMQEFSSHQTCKDFKTEMNDFKMQVKNTMADKKA